MELNETTRRPSETDRQTITENLKIEINNLLWTRLPESTTIGQAEKMATAMFRMIEDEWDKA
jgi:hypothetical protein